MNTLQMFQILQDYRHNLEVQKCYTMAERNYQDYFEPEVDYFQKNKDLPDNLQWFEMGIVSRENEHLDPADDEIETKYGKKTIKVNTMNDRHFREMCVQIAGKNYAMKLKKKPDIEPPNYLRIEWIAEKLQIPHDLAKQAIEIFKEMEFDRKTIMKIFYKEPYLWMECSGKEIARDLEDLNMMHIHASEPIESIWGRTEGDPISEDWIYMTDEVIESIEVGRFDESKNGVIDDKMDITSPAYPFAVFPLYYGNEALSHDFITMIREADYNKIKQIQARFFPQYDPVIGRHRAPEYWYLTGTQKSQAWIYIKARKKELKEISVKELSDSAKICLHWIRQYGKSKYSTGIIFAFAEGKKFDLFGEKIEFTKPAKPEETQYMWSQYQKITA